jgi:hypothetical protein
MAVTNITALNVETNDPTEVVGTGALAGTDILVTDTKNYQIGAKYFDAENGYMYVRLAVSTPGVLGDWYKVELTQAS